MERLRCGVILTEAFTTYLQERFSSESPAHPGQILAFEYLHCGEGERAGQAWLDSFWIKHAGLSATNIFRVGEMDLYLSPQTQRGLRWHYLEIIDGAPSVG